ncbi:MULTISPECIES: TonB-dependent siderophore receptor [Methylosinus]|uniref:TonB-dependent siderophore receptor n=1 Tax=Methylosinus trichosporium (strain ATCC 35070 / NCIMB 11131 / UNIQEM 75 / OB3b) TaxID=595536 RepID=A0A2D2D1D0_METT3|nr:MULTISPECIES: TonB-dependent siderophore receptor [Methylosinus]ATQ68792.1 TonB-dependent siderophore receptor [Methylosinus trichosporium OB3b]OBS51661.1 TonB-dependent receptor [Methylosinus sp. 3S-1]
MRPFDLPRGASACALMISLCSAHASAQEALPAIDVAGSGAPSSGKQSLSGSPADTETGYRRTTAFGATKTNTPLLNTPVAVQIVPREVIVDKQVLDTMEAVKNVSGVQASTGTFYDQYLIRGFTSGYGMTWRNGLKLEGLIGGEEIAFTERVEIVKGPGSVLYGRIEPGGFVNVVTKRPQEEFKAELNQQVGNWGLARTTVDITGAVDKEKTALFRLMGAYDRSDSFTDFDHRDNGAAALFLTFRPTEQFEFNAQFEHYQKKQTTPDGSGTIPVNIVPGIVNYPINLPRHFSVSDPALWGNFPYVVHRTLYGYDWTYKFDEDWKLRNRFHYVDHEENQTGLANWGGWDGSTGDITRTFVHNPLKRSMLSTNLDLTGEIITGPLRHKTLVGLDWYKYQDDWVGDYGFTLPTAPLNIYSPVYGNLTGILHQLADSARSNVLWRTRRQDFGVYAQDQISLFDDRLQILLGGRWDKASAAVASVYGGDWESCFPSCTGYPLNTYSDKPKLSPRAAVLYRLTDNISVFGGYVRSFGANNGASASGQVYAPEEAYQWEAGAKSVWLDGDVTASVTLFDLTKKNILKADPLNPGLSLPVGVVNSRGVELDIAGKVTENLSVIGSYTFDVAKIVDDNNNGFAGHRFNSVAPHVGNIWAKWDTAPNQPEGWELGFGAYASDERWGADDNTWKMPAYVKFDSMAAWRTLIEDHKVTFRFNVKNLSDTKYFERSDGWMFAYYGAPRTFIGSVNFQF